jgi:hypothetical protein
MKSEPSFISALFQDGKSDDMPQKKVQAVAAPGIYLQRDRIKLA